MKSDTKKYSLKVCTLLSLVLISSCTKLEKVSSVSTGYVTEIKSNTVEVSGTIIDLGEGATGYGFCYGKTPNVTFANNNTMLGIPKEVGVFRDNFTGLEEGTKYYYKAYLSNGTVTVFGKELSFTTFKASLPSLFTKSICSITSTCAGSGGGVMTDGGAEIVVCGVCWSLNEDPSVNDAHTSDTIKQGIFSSSMTGLLPFKSYFVRAYAANYEGVAYGNQVEFITKADIPKVITVAPEMITSTTAVSGGNVLDDQGSVVVNRGVCYNESGNPCALDTKTSDGSGIGAFTSSLEGLTPNTSYFVRAYAVNSIDTAYGTILQFSTPDLPSVSTVTVSNITVSTASAGGNISSDGGSVITGRGVCWSTANNPDISDYNTTDGSGTGSFSSTLTGLFPGTKYFVRAYATNTSGTIYGDELTFTTLNSSSAVPSSTISNVTNVSNTSVTVSGAVLANGNYTTVVFEYGVSGQFPYSVSAVPNIISGASITMINAELKELTPGALYSVRIKAINTAGTSFSNILTFITTQMPFAETKAATSITKNSAKLNGSVNPYNASATVTFEYGLTISYGFKVTAGQSPVTGSTVSDVNASIYGLSSDHTYHFRIMAVSSGGTTYGEDKTFKTSK